MNIKKLVLTESDGTVTTSDISTSLTTVVATMDDDSEVTLFPTVTPTPGDVPSISIPLDTPIKIVAA